MLACAYQPARMKHRVTLQRRIMTADGQGGYAESWSDVATLYAEIAPTKGYERIQAMQLQAPITHKVTIRHRPGLDPSMRLLYGLRVLQIREAINLDEASRFWQLLCVEMAPLAPAIVGDPVLALFQDRSPFLFQDGSNLAFSRPVGLQLKDDLNLTLQDGAAFALQ